MEFPAVILIFINVSGTPHAFMALIEIEAELKKHLEPSKQKAEERIDGLSAIVRETTQTLSDWDSETEKSVSVLHKARDEQVSLRKLHCNIPEKICHLCNLIWFITGLCEPSNPNNCLNLTHDINKLTKKSWRSSLQDW